MLSLFMHVMKIEVMDHIPEDEFSVLKAKLQACETAGRDDLSVNIEEFAQELDRHALQTEACYLSCASEPYRNIILFGQATPESFEARSQSAYRIRLDALKASLQQGSRYVLGRDQRSKYLSDLLYLYQHLKQRQELDSIIRGLFASIPRKTGEAYETHLWAVQEFARQFLAGIVPDNGLFAHSPVADGYEIAFLHDLIEDTQAFVYRISEPVGGGEGDEPAGILEKNWLISGWEYARSEEQLSDIRNLLANTWAVEFQGTRLVLAQPRQGVVDQREELYQDQNVRYRLWHGLDNGKGKRQSYAIRKEYNRQTGENYYYIVVIPDRQKDAHLIHPLQAEGLRALTKDQEAIDRKRANYRQQHGGRLSEGLINAWGKVDAEIDHINTVCERVRATLEPTTAPAKKTAEAGSSENLTYQQVPASYSCEVAIGPEGSGQRLHWNFKCTLLVIKLMDKLHNLLTINGMAIEDNDGRKVVDPSVLDGELKASILGCTRLQAELRLELAEINPGLHPPVALPIDVARLGLLMLRNHGIGWLADHLKQKQSDTGPAGYWLQLADLQEAVDAEWVRHKQDGQAAPGPSSDLGNQV